MPLLHIFPGVQLLLEQRRQKNDEAFSALTRLQRQLITQNHELLHETIKAKRTTDFWSSFLRTKVTADTFLCLIIHNGYLLFMNVKYFQFDKPDSPAKSIECSKQNDCSTFFLFLLPLQVHKKAKIYPQCSQTQKLYACCPLILHEKIHYFSAAEEYLR